MIANPPRRTSSLVTLSTTLLLWILGLALAFRFLFGAGVSAGWIIAGAVFSVAAACGWLLVEELKGAVECRALRKAGKNRQPATPPAIAAISARTPAKPAKPAKAQPKTAGGPLPRQTTLRKTSTQPAPARVPATAIRRQVLGLGSSKPGSGNRRRRFGFGTAWLATRVKKTRRPLIDRLQPVRL